MDIKKIVEKMTTKEKVAQLNQQLYGWQIFEKKEDEFVMTDEFKRYVKDIGGIGAIYGIMRADPWSGINYDNGMTPQEYQSFIAKVQEYIKENSRFNIGALIVEETPHGHQGLYSNIYPTSLAVGATFNPSLYESMLKEIQAELFAKGGNVALLMGLDVARDVRWGRCEETHGEDPYLCAQMTKVVPKSFDDKKVIPCLKTFSGHGEPNGGLNSGATSIGPRELHEIHLPPIVSASDEGLQMIMASYNEIDGIPSHANKELLTDLLVDDIGFDGVVMADGLAIDRLKNSYVKDYQAAAIALNCGVGLSLWDESFTTLCKSVEENLVELATLDAAVIKILKLKEQLGLIGEEPVELNDYKNNTQVNLEVARESICLLKNEKLLPLNKKDKVVLLGYHIDDIDSLLGDYTPPVTGTYFDISSGMNNIGENVTFIKCIKDGQFIKEVINENKDIIKNADAVICSMGGSSRREYNNTFDTNGALLSNEGNYSYTDSGENVDIADISIKEFHVRMVEYVSKLNSNIISLVIAGRPYCLRKIEDESKVILYSFYSGQLGGLAIAETIYGINNPSGKLPMSIPNHEFTPNVFYNAKKDSRNKNYFDVKVGSKYHFGYGLTYSNIQYDQVDFDKDKLSINNNDHLDITVTLSNNSKVDAFETIQVYLSFENNLFTRREKELRKFIKVTIPKKSVEKFKLRLELDDFKILNRNCKFAVEPSMVKIFIGSSRITLFEHMIEIK